MLFNVFNGLPTEDKPACVTIVGQVRVDHLGLTDEEQAVRALALAKEAYKEYPHPAVMPA
jgi:hypothetical protein